MIDFVLLVGLYAAWYIKTVVTYIRIKLNEQKEDMKETKCYCGHTTYCDCGPEEPKQETTLEEFIESQPYYGTCTYEYKEGIEVGTKWQKEQILDFLYSEITERRDYSASKMCEKVIEFIEQYKNK